MPTALSKETAITLSIGTIISVGAAVISGALWVQSLVNDLQSYKEEIGKIELRTGIIENEVSQSINSSLVSLERAIVTSRCREDELKDILDDVVSTVDTLSIIIETGGGDAAYRRSVPQLRSLIRRLENWKCR